MKVALVLVLLALAGHTAAIPDASNPIFCQVCTDLVKELESWVESNSTETSIISFLEEICGDLPSGDQGTCKEIIDKYGPAILQIIFNAIPFDDICKDLGLCAVPPALARRGPMDDCSVCKLLFSTVDSVLTDPDDQKTILASVETLCTSLGPLASVCDDLVNQFGPQILDDLAKELDPTSVCTELHIC